VQRFPLGKGLAQDRPLHPDASAQEDQLAAMPRRPKSDPRDRYVSFRCTEAEVTRLQRRASDAGMSVSDYARHLLLADVPKDAGTPMLAIIDNPGARLLAEQVRRVGVNINQIAHRMNELRIPPPTDLMPVLEEIRSYVRQARVL
jgi:hypothetical protein